jgi:2,3-bisphosphoglycerate-independent phosphoglycerate mutase
MIVGAGSDKVKSFNEKDAPKGSLGHMKGEEIMPKLIKEAKNA